MCLSELVLICQHIVQSIELYGILDYDKIINNYYYQSRKFNNCLWWKFSWVDTFMLCSVSKYYNILHTDGASALTTKWDVAIFPSMMFHITPWPFRISIRIATCIFRFEQEELISVLVNKWKHSKQIQYKFQQIHTVSWHDWKERIRHTFGFPITYWHKTKWKGYLLLLLYPNQTSQCMVPQFCSQQYHPCSLGQTYWCGMGVLRIPIKQNQWMMF